jgi:hypothetical protein
LLLLVDPGEDRLAPVAPVAAERDAERARLGSLMARLLNRRTLVTSRLGLTECGG